MYIRSGSLLKLFKIALGEDLNSICEIMESPQSTLSSFISGARYPGLESAYRHKLERHFSKSLSDLGVHCNFDITDYVLKILRLEECIRSTFLKGQELPFRALAAKILSFYGSNEQIVDPIDPIDILRMVFCKNENETEARILFARYLINKSIKSDFSVLTEWGVPEPCYLVDSSALKIKVKEKELLASLPLAIDTLMALVCEYYISVNADQQHKVMLSAKLDYALHDMPISVIGKSLIQ